MTGKSKVFGIGVAKTGTTSLGQALTILGLNHKSYDYELSNNYYVKGEYEPIFREAKKYDSFEDGPWNRGEFYKLLDREFPDSKFILTIRDLQNWIKSHEQHFSAHGSRRIRSELWQYDYDQQKKSKLIRWYEQRTKNVLQYFQNRPEDLLIINICAGEGWEKLCSFLSLPMPTQPFPHANITPNSQRIDTWKKLKQFRTFVNNFHK